MCITTLGTNCSLLMSVRLTLAVRCFRGQRRRSHQQNAPQVHHALSFFTGRSARTSFDNRVMFVGSGNERCTETLKAEKTAGRGPRYDGSSPVEINSPPVELSARCDPQRHAERSMFMVSLPLDTALNGHKCDCRREGDPGGEPPHCRVRSSTFLC